MALAGALLAEMHVHHRGAGVERGLRLARHLFRRDRHVMLLRIGEHAGERAGDHGLVVHGVSSARCSLAAAAPALSTTRTWRVATWSPGLTKIFADRAVALGADLVLHLHRLEHDDALAAADAIARLGEHRDDRAVHRRHQPSRTFAAARRCGLERRLPRRDGRAVEVEMQHVIAEGKARRSAAGPWP